MERNAIIATVLVIGILLGYQWYLSRFESPAPEPQHQGPAQPTEQKVIPSQPPAVQAAPATQVRRKSYTPTSELHLSAKDVVVDTPLVHVVFSTAGAQATHWQLKAYKLADGEPVDLLGAQAGAPGSHALATWADSEQSSAVYEVDQERLDLAPQSPARTITFKHVTASGLSLQKQVTFRPDRYDVEVNFTIQNVADENRAAQPRILWGPGFHHTISARGAVQPPTLWLDGKRVQEDIAKINGEKVVEGKLSWVALEDSYFAAAFLPKDKDLRALVAKGPENQGIVGLVSPKQTLTPGAEFAIKAQVYGGPRDLDTLKVVGQDLDQLIDLGWFWFLARPALWLLKFLYHYTGNYGIAIILITILQKVVFYPLTFKSMKSMQAMQAIQPKVQALQERYKNNPQKKQEETMALYRKHGVNPMGGCLPMLIQIPIFVALYNALSSSVEMWQAKFLWIRDLTQPDMLFGITIWGGYPFNFLALLMGVSMWFQQKMSPTGGDPRQAQMMLWTMPIIFTFMFWSFPSGLVLYWFVNNILQIGQQWLINRESKQPPAPDAQPA